MSLQEVNIVDQESQQMEIAQIAPDICFANLQEKPFPNLRLIGE